MEPAGPRAVVQQRVAPNGAAEKAGRFGAHATSCPPCLRALELAREVNQLIDDDQELSRVERREVARLYRSARRAMCALGRHLLTAADAALGKQGAGEQTPAEERDGRAKPMT